MDAISNSGSGFGFGFGSIDTSVFVLFSIILGSILGFNFGFIFSVGKLSKFDVSSSIFFFIISLGIVFFSFIWTFSLILMFFSFSIFLTFGLSFISIFLISWVSDELNFFSFIWTCLDSEGLISFTSLGIEVVSETFIISIGIIVGIYIGFGSKKFGIPIANNKIAKCKKKEKENPK